MPGSKLEHRAKFAKARRTMMLSLRFTRSKTALRALFSALCLWSISAPVFSQSTQEPVASAAQLEKPESTPAPAEPQAPFVTVASGRAGLVGDGVAAFFPQGMDEKNAPPSLALLKRLVISAPLADTWNLKPVFLSNGKVFRASVAVPANVDLYGGGQVTGPLRRNGTRIKVWNTDNYQYKKDGGKRLYQSHPWIMGLRPDGSAFGVLFDSTWKAELSCEGAITFETHGPAFPVIVIERSSPAGVLHALADLTGTIDLPPLWALGYQQCRWSYYPDTRVREIADEFRARRLPCDVIWMDIHYMDGYRIFTFDKKLFPDPKGLNQYLHNKGFKSVWMIDPGIKTDPNYSVYTSGQKNDAFVRTASGTEFNGNVWPGPCAFPDYTRPDVRAWWAGLYKDFMATGIDGVWNDMNEPAVFKGPDGTMPEDNVHLGGDGLPSGNHRQYHNVYGMLMARATREGILAANPDRRPFVLTRASFLGGQRYAATWTGDNSSTEADMKLSVPMSLTLGLAGQPFNGPDLGGFAENATGALWSRWVGFGALFPFARGHASNPTNQKEPWAFGDQVERTARIALERRYRLLPYFYTLFHEASVNGMPVMRPMFMAEPANPALRTEQGAFLVGNDLIVVPAWVEKPALPSPDWPVVSLIEGDRADPDQASLRLRPGAIVPLCDVIQNTTEYAASQLTLLVCLDAQGKASGTLYEDAGEGFGHREGDFLLTTFKAQKSGDEVRLSVSKTEGRRPPARRTVRVQVVDPCGAARSFEQNL